MSGVWNLIGDPTKTGRGVSWLWGVPYYGLEIAWSQRHHWFIGRTTRAYKGSGW